MIRLATNADLEQIMLIVHFTIKEMHSSANFQWDENYPTLDDFLGDIENRELYVMEINHAVLGFACINQDQPQEYAGVPWNTADNAFVIHRLAIHPDGRKRGLARTLCMFADELAQANQVYAMRTDTFSGNHKVQALFNKLEYTFVGEISFRGKEKPFYCYEKRLGSPYK